jgi:competence protein ComEA
VRTPARSRNDGDVIRARLRVLLAEGRRSRGWVPEDEEGPADDDQCEPNAWAGDETEDPDDETENPDDDGADDVALPSGLGRHRTPGRTARLDPGRPGAWALWAVAVLAAAVVVGWTWLGRPAVDQVEQVPVTASTTAAPSLGTPARTPPDPAGSGSIGSGSSGTVVVSVVGQVVAPGLVTLPAGSRIADALAAVGGLLPGSDPAAVNAAAVLTDGQQIAVGVPGAVQSTRSGAGAPATGGALLDLNSATVADFDALPGIGPVLAQRIVDHRSAHGPFTSVDQLDDVSGIGPAIFADLATRVRV